jgi:cyclohexa-1,5-dienecarbonyl-CoA hydratase
VSSPLRIWFEREGRLLRLRLARPKANIVDAEMIAALIDALDQHLDNRAIGAVLLDAEGPHFSFGASVEEHLPEACAGMLAALHQLILKLVSAPVPTLCAIRGQCLGGGLEVALACGRLFAATDAALGQPEIKIGVFAPAASCLLPGRVGQSAAEDLLYTGRSVSGDEALALGLVDDLSDDPEAAALAWFDQHLAGLSASSLRHAVTAVRRPVVERLALDLARVETLYLENLMITRDAVEGLQAFIDKRKPGWEHR